MKKTCTQCGAVKPLTEFGPDKRRRDGRASECRACKREYDRKRARRLRAARAADPGPRRCSRCKQVKPRDAFVPTMDRCKACHAERCVEQRHGLPKNARAAMLTRQAGLCWLCGRALLPTGTAQPHVLGRGTSARLVCKGCWLALRDAPDADTLERAAEYVEAGDLGIPYRGKPYNYPDMEALFIRLGDAADWECPICARAMDPTAPLGRADRAVLDHDDVTGMVRGVIHDPCNRMIGHADHDPEALYALAAYARQQEATTNA